MEYRIDDDGAGKTAIGSPSHAPILFAHEENKVPVRQVLEDLIWSQAMELQPRDEIIPTRGMPAG